MRPASDKKNMNIADFLSSAYGSAFQQNQTAFDDADNGAIESGGGQTTVKSPSWLDSLMSVGTGVLGSVLGKKNAAPSVPPGTPPRESVPGVAPKSNMMWWIIGGAGVLLAVVWMIFRRKP